MSIWLKDSLRTISWKARPSKDNPLPDNADFDDLVVHILTTKKLSISPDLVSIFQLDGSVVIQRSLLVPQGSSCENPFIYTIPETDTNGLTVRDLILNGATLLPAMHEVGHTPTKPTSSHNEVTLVVGSTFELCALPQLALDPSALLASGTYNGKAVSIDFSGEASVESSVMMLVMDILKALNLFGGLTVHQQASTDSQERGDLFVLTVFGVVILIVEAKRESMVWNELVHRKCLGQPFNYMQTNRECFSLSYCFSVWTTYNHCRIVWLNDAEHNALAAATVVDPANKFVLPPNQYDWSSRSVCASRIFGRNDNIPMVLACLIWKLCNAQLLAKTTLLRSIRSSSIAAISTEVDNPTKNQDSGKLAVNLASKTNKKKKGKATVTVAGDIRQGKLRTVNKDGYYFKINQRAVDDLTFEMPIASGRFHLLLQHNGRDGKAWVAANISGHLAVVKFRHADKKFKFSMNVTEEADLDEVVELFAVTDLGSNSNSTLVNAELKAWRDVYGSLGGGRPFIATLAGREALVIPFAFCFGAGGNLSTRLSTYLPCDDSFGDGMKNWTEIQSLLLAQRANPVKLLFAAIMRVAEAGYTHKDIKWEHLALLPVFDSKSSTVRLEPILVDLADVEKDSDGLAVMSAFVLASVLHTESERAEFEQLLNQKNI